MRIAFALDCCDREALGFVATTEGIKGEDVQDLMIAAVEARFGPVNSLPHTIEWLSPFGTSLRDAPSGNGQRIMLHRR